MKGAVWILAAAAAATAGIVAAQPAAAPPAPAAPQAPQAPAPGAAPASNGTAPRTIVAPTTPPLEVPALNTTEEAPPATNTTAAPPKAPEAPQRRARYDVAVLQALDKVTAETLRFEAPVGRPIRYKTLIFTVRACERSAPDEPVEDSAAYIEILSQPRPEPGGPALPARQAFKGWMYASSPGLNPLEHPVYDAWLITCRAAVPPAGAPPAPAH